VRLSSTLRAKDFVSSTPKSHQIGAQPPSQEASSADSRFAALVRDYGRLITSAVRRVGRTTTEQDREDIEQTVLLGLWRQVSREQTIDHPVSYVYKAAVRETVRAVARLRARPELPLEEAVDDAKAERQSEADRGVEAREQREALAAALRALPPDRARAVKAHLAGFSVDEVMQLYGWTYQRARNLIARGMADLRAELRLRGQS